MKKKLALTVAGGTCTDGDLHLVQKGRNRPGIVRFRPRQQNRADRRNKAGRNLKAKRDLKAGRNDRTAADRKLGSCHRL